MINYKSYLGFKDKSVDRSCLKDTMGRYLTQALFYETARPDTPYQAIYCMGESKKGLPSARDIYLESIDEYDAALKLVGDLGHWRRLTSQNERGEYSCNWFMMGTEAFEGLLQWREDMRLRDESMAKARLMEQSDLGNVTAAKALMEASKVKNNAGRPKHGPSDKDLKRAKTLERMRHIGLSVNDTN